jgi:thiol:disulfide interchange protein DsbD
VLNKLNAKSQGNGFTSVLLMGLTFSLTSFTCTVPFVGSALFSASQGEWFYPIIGMLGFSAVFAAPFFLLALFPSAMTKLPKAGGWMNNIKVVMGFLEIAAAIKFVSNVDFAWGLGIMPRELFLAIWIGCGILITLYILGVFRLSHDSRVESVGTVRVVFALIFASITFYLISGLQGKELGEINAYLPPNDYKEIISGTQIASVSTGTAAEPGEKPANSEISWFNNYDQAVSESKKLNKPLFVDFSGFQCTNCRWMELNMFPRKSIKDVMNRMVLVRLYTDKKEEPYLSYKKMQIERYKSIALPLYVIITPDGEVLGTKAFTRDENEFRTFLLKAFPVTSAEMN